MVNDHYEQIIKFLSIGKVSDDFTTSQNKQLVVWAAYFQLIAGELYKMGLAEILRLYVLLHEQERILAEAHDEVVGGHYGGCTSARKILWVGL